MTVWRLILSAIGSVSVLTGVFIFSFPNTFYDAIPGLNLMGPFSVHFIRDVGLAYLAGGCVLTASGALSDRRLAFAGVLWFVLHALFHLQIWLHRGLPFDHIFWFDLFAVILPSVLALWAGLKLPQRETG